MTSRKSSSTGEGLPSNRPGERTPLRSLENDLQRFSTPSHTVKSKSLLGLDDDSKTTREDGPLCDVSPATSVMKNTAVVDDIRAEEIFCGLGDVTFKSDSCTGGEVEISDFSACTGHSIILPSDQLIKSTWEIEDTFTSDSMIVQSCSEHVEHPYYTLERRQDSGPFRNDCCEETNVKTFVCDGGEVEVSDVTKLHNNTVPLPKEQLSECVEDEGFNSTNLSECHQLCGAEHADHPYSSTENDLSVVTSLSDSTNSCVKPANALKSVILKSFNCTGGEIEILDDIEPADESVPLSGNQAVTCNESCTYNEDPSILVDDHDLLNCKDHSDHPYCNNYKSENSPTAQSGNISPAPLISPRSAEVICDEEICSSSNQTDICEEVALDSCHKAAGELENTKVTDLSQETSPLPEQEAGLTLDDNVAPAYVLQAHIQEDSEQPNCHEGKNDVVTTCQSSQTNTSFKHLSNESFNRHVQETDSASPQDSALPLVVDPVFVGPQDLNNLLSSRVSHESSEGKDSALGSTGNGHVLYNSEGKCSSENLTDVLKALSDCPLVASALPFRLLSPILRRASLSLQKNNRDPNPDQFFGGESALNVEKTLVAPANLDPAELWGEQLESPMPRPLLNSTAICFKPQSDPISEPEVDVKPCVLPQSKVEKPAFDIPVIQDGPLQQQLRQMAEFLMLASGKMGPVAVSASSERAAPVESQSVGVGTTSVRMVDHSLNTSGQFERKRDFDVADSCTLTDPLLWNVPPGSLESLPRQELEQRLRSSMIMVEALVQQLAAARAQGPPTAGPPPSELREKLVQTDHTELNQTTMYRDLYMEALSRISQLELDGRFLQNLIQSMQDMRVTMTSLSSDTEAALSNMSQIGDVIREDHQSLVSHYDQMKSLLQKTKETQKKMMQKVKDALQQRDDMRTQMEEAFTAKQAAFSAMEQVRTHCATKISYLEECVGSQKELLAALNQAYPEQVALNQAYNETLSSASDLLNQNMEDQSSLTKDLYTVRGLLQTTAPMLLKLNEKAAAALRERDEHESAREQAVEERMQIEEELSQANLDLQTAREQIGDLNLQVTILTSEMGVLRQKLTEREEDRGQLERKVTELSATVSSTLASYTFLEQALAAETTKLQQSWKDIQQATDRANELEMSLGQSEQSVFELNHALALREEQLSQLQTLSMSQKAEIQQLEDRCTQLNGVREMNEFLQMENELARDQVAESERLLRENLQALRERNIQCEDLKHELGQLQLENRTRQEQLEATRSKARATQLELGEKLAQAVTEITLLHHTLRGLTNELHRALDDQKPATQKEVHSVERRHPASSFVDSVMVAITSDKEEVKAEMPPEPDVPDPQCETLFSEMSAFTRIPVTPKKKMNAAEFAPEEEEEQSNVAELLADLGRTVSELVETLNLVRQRKDAQLEKLHNTISDLQREQQAANSTHETEVFELKHQLRHLNSLVERGNQALQQKSQDEKTLSKLMMEIKETHEILNKHKTENNDLRKEVVELRRSLQQSKVESQFLRGELRKSGGPSATPAHFMEEKIQLLKEVERLKTSLQEVEQARLKLLERAKRHQMIHQTNQQKSENELQMLNNMILKVRETLISLPEVVKSCEELQHLVEYIG